MAITAEYDFEIVRASDDQFIYRRKIDGVYQSYTGYTASLAVKKGSTTMFTLTSGASEIVLSTTTVTDDTITVKFPHAKTAIAPGGQYAYDLKLVDGSGNVSYPLQGRIKVKQNIT